MHGERMRERELHRRCINYQAYMRVTWISTNNAESINVFQQKKNKSWPLATAPPPPTVFWIIEQLHSRASCVVVPDTFAAASTALWPPFRRANRLTRSDIITMLRKIRDSAAKASSSSSSSLARSLYDGFPRKRIFHPGDTGAFIKTSAREAFTSY